MWRLLASVHLFDKKEEAKCLAIIIFFHFLEHKRFGFFLVKKTKYFFLTENEFVYFCGFFVCHYANGNYLPGF